MQIRILQVRGYDSTRRPPPAARGMQALTTPIFGGTKEGVDPDGQYRKDSPARAYNQQLAVKKCKTFDLDAELASTATDADARIDRKRDSAAAELRRERAIVTGATRFWCKCRV